MNKSAIVLICVLNVLTLAALSFFGCSRPVIKDCVYNNSMGFGESACVVKPK